MLDLRKGMLTFVLQHLKQYSSKLFTPMVVICTYCRNQIRNSTSYSMGLCHSCQHKIPWISQIHCKICGRYKACTDCHRRKETYFIMSRSAVEYSDEMRAWLARYKYRGDESLLPLFVEMLRYPYERLKLALPKSDKKFDYITYIPLSPERLAERGFNQAQQFAEGIGRAYNIPVILLLKRVLHTGKQSYKTRQQRLNDVHHVFKYQDPGIFVSEQHHILIIDDVYTTGSTLNQCSAVIREQTKAQIYGLTWAR
jgi:competence protein ComFC